MTSTIEREKDQEFIEPSREQRRRNCIAYVVLVLVMAATLEAYERLYEPFLDGLPLCERIDWVGGTMIAICAVLAAFGCGVMWSAYRVLRAGQMPVSAAFLIARVRLYRGRAARWRAWGLAAWGFGVICIAAAIVLFMYNGHDKIERVRHLKGCDAAQGAARKGAQ